MVRISEVDEQARMARMKQNLTRARIYRAFRKVLRVYPHLGLQVSRMDLGGRASVLVHRDSVGDFIFGVQLNMLDPLSLETRVVYQSASAPTGIPCLNPDMSISDLVIESSQLLMAICEVLEKETRAPAST